MNIDIGEYKIKTDAYNYILCKRIVGKNKEGHRKVYYTNLGYYPSIETLSKGAANHMIRESGAETLQDLIQEIKQIEEKICSAFNSRVLKGK